VKRNRHRSSIKRRIESGSILGIAAIGMLTFILAAGLCIDISHLYLVGTELQNAADAAALAGASALNSTSTGIATAVDRAILTMNKYEFNGTDITIGRSDVRFAVNLSSFDSGGTGLSESAAAASPQNIRFIKVTVPPKTTGVYFIASAMGGSTIDLTRTAVAGQSVGLNVICNVAPLSVVEDPDSGAPLNVNPECPDKTRFTPGCTYVCRLGSGGNGNGNNGSGSISPGNYLILGVTGRGGSDARELLAAGTTVCVTAGEEVDTKPGVASGPIRQGMNVRFDEYAGGLDPAIYPPDTNIMENITYLQYRSGSASYQQAPSHAGRPNRRVLIIPIVDADEYDNGRDTIRIDRFGAFFIKQKVANGNGGDITVEYVTDRVIMGDGGYLPNGNASAQNITVAVLYR
jgi:Flp pilus assembly protein TadG